MDNKLPFRLDRVLFTRSIVEAIPGHVPPDPLPDIQITNNITVDRFPEEPRKYIVIMRSVVNADRDQSQPYHIDMECIANFVGDGSEPEDVEARGVTIVGHSVCYGAIREAVAWLTARQPYGPVSLGLSVLNGPTPPEQTSGSPTD